MDYLTQAVNWAQSAFSAGQYGALLVAFGGVYIAFKTTEQILQTVVMIIACLAVIYFVAPDFYSDLFQLLNEMIGAGNGFLAGR